eukprot:CAMPEP_0196149482 /NCGR_PEP_ID=MMETSP0910-20130528/29905_1 /TAXON_ID=49265 /ORGANISM="Thalassiosira rotula, Strain GSO102" /LENGTH=270 /DNA_ID=CAMNT_0041412391 /DNA_START=283 /DNA_END=1092 /DNA_ORIENTATION=-
MTAWDKQMRSGEIVANDAKSRLANTISLRRRRIPSLSLSNVQLKFLHLPSLDLIDDSFAAVDFSDSSSACPAILLFRRSSTAFLARILLSNLSLLLGDLPISADSLIFFCIVDSFTEIFRDSIGEVDFSDGTSSCPPISLLRRSSTAFFARIFFSNLSLLLEDLSLSADSFIFFFRRSSKDSFAVSFREWTRLPLTLLLSGIALEGSGTGLGLEGFIGTTVEYSLIFFFTRCSYDSLSVDFRDVTGGSGDGLTEEVDSTEADSIIFFFRR